MNRSIFTITIWTWCQRAGREWPWAILGTSARRVREVAPGRIGCRQLPAAGVRHANTQIRRPIHARRGLPGPISGTGAGTRSEVSFGPMGHRVRQVRRQLGLACAMGLMLLVSVAVTGSAPEGTAVRPPGPEFQFIRLAYSDNPTMSSVVSAAAMSVPGTRMPPRPSSTSCRA